MAKKAGVPLLKNWIKRKATGPKPPKKQRLAKPEKSAVLFDENSPEEGLEDTPVFPVQPVQIERVDSTEEKAAKTVSGSSPVVANSPVGKRAVIRHTRKGWFSGAIHSALDGVIRLFTGMRKKNTGNAAALAFAGSQHRLGKKGRRNRRILIYAGSSLATAVVVLLVLLVPGGAAAPVDVYNTGVVADANATDSVNTMDSESGTVTATATVVSTPSPTPVPTTVAEPTDNPIDMDELLEFYVVNADNYYNEYYYSSNHYDYTNEELHMLAQVIWGEARGESLTGKIAVANVVMNRVLCRGAWPNTIAGVITAGGQFTGYKSTNPTTGCISAARWVLDYERWVIPQDVYFFKSGGTAGVDWGGHTFYKKIGGHCFYRESYAGRRRNAGVPERLFERVYKYAQYGCEPADRVYRIQFMLDALGYNIEKVDSYFGEGTKKALIKFQQDHGLDDDGVAGPATVQRLIEEYGIRNYYAKFCT